MSMGAYDEAEHERRERMTSQVEPGTDDTRKTYRGTVQFDTGDSADALLEQFKKMKSES